MNLRRINVILLFVVAVLSNEAISFTDDELVSVRVCGDALQGNNPCDWVKHVETTVSYLGENKDLNLSVVDFVEVWFKEREWTSLRHANVKVVDKSGWFYFSQPNKKTVHVNVLIYDLDSSSDNLALSVATSTSEKYQIFSYSCPRSNQVETDQCLFKKIEAGLALLLSGTFKSP